MSHHEIAEKAGLSSALVRMSEALRMLDEAGAPGEIGGCLDLAIARLEEQLGVDRGEPASPDEYLPLLDAGPKDGIAEPKSASRQHDAAVVVLNGDKRLNSD